MIWFICFLNGLVYILKYENMNSPDIIFLDILFEKIVYLNIH